MMRLTLFLVMMFGVFSWSSCGTEESEALFIQDVVLPIAPSCIAESNGTVYRTNGTLDVLNPDPNATNTFIPSYAITPRIYNNLMEEESLPSYEISDEGADYMRNTFRVQVIGYNVCISGIQSDDPQRHCEDISDAVNYFVPSGIAIEPGELGVDWFPITSSDAILSYFGSLNNIPSDGEWVVIRFRAVGRQDNGSEVSSNEFHYPLLVCRGCRGCPTGTTPDYSDVCFTYQDASPDCS